MHIRSDWKLQQKDRNHKNQIKVLEFKKIHSKIDKECIQYVHQYTQRQERLKELENTSVEMTQTRIQKVSEEKKEKHKRISQIGGTILKGLTYM